MNQTFQELAVLQDLRQVWAALSPQVFTFLNDSNNMELLQVRPAGCVLGCWGAASLDRC